MTDETPEAFYNRDAQYQVVAARRTAFDGLVWQVPVLSLTGQAFLFTIALAPDTGRLPRAIAAALALASSVLSMQLMSRHRRCEVSDAEWLHAYETGVFGESMHGEGFRTRLAQTSAGMPLSKYRSYRPWVVGLGLFGLAAAVVLVLTAFAPAVLTD